MKLIRKLLITLAIVVVLIGGIFFGGVGYLNHHYQIDTFSTIRSLKKLSANVDENSLFPVPFDEKDLLRAKVAFAPSFDGFIQEGKNGIEFHPENIKEGNREEIVLDEKALAAISKEAIQNYQNGEVTIGDYSFPLSLLSLDLTIQSELKTGISIILKLDIQSVKKDFSSFPKSLFSKYLPDFLYFTINFFNDHLDSPFSYQVTGNSTTLNALSTEESTSLFETIGKFISFPSGDEIALKCGNMMMETLIGSEKKDGVLKQLSSYGVTDYCFKQVLSQDCFIVEC